VRHQAGVVSHVAGDHRPLAVGLDHHAGVARGVADGRREADLWRDHVIQRHPLDEAGVEDRLDTIAELRLLLRVLAGLPEVVLVPTDELPRLWEGRHAPAILEHRVPAHVVDVQVRAHHGVDCVTRPVRLVKVLQDWSRQRLAIGDLLVGDRSQRMCQRPASAPAPRAAAREC
jgi:hypothetical protein